MAPSEFGHLNFEQLEQLHRELATEIEDLRAEYKAVGRELDKRRSQFLRDNPPDPGQVIGR